MKKVLALLLLILIGVSVYLFIVRSYDIRFKFEVTTLPEIAYMTLKTWVETQADFDQINYDLPHLSLTHVFQKDDAKYHIEWHVIERPDSVSLITASVSGNGNIVNNRAGSLLFETPIKTDGKKIVKDFFNKLNAHLGKVKVRIEGIEAFEEQLCLCTKNNTTQFGKAFGMMTNYQAISDVIVENKLSLTGNPLVVVNEWDQTKDVLNFDFCFPVSEKVKLNNSEFFYKKIDKLTALKAIYNGNYITSDRAWFALKGHAQKYGLKIVKKPIEVFYNNPNIESEETKWRADIYMPILNE